MERQRATLWSTKHSRAVRSPAWQERASPYSNYSRVWPACSQTTSKRTTNSDGMSSSMSISESISDSSSMSCRESSGTCSPAWRPRARTTAHLAATVAARNYLVPQWSVVHLYSSAVLWYQVRPAGAGGRVTVARDMASLSNTGPFRAWPICVRARLALRWLRTNVERAAGPAGSLPPRARRHRFDSRICVPLPLFLRSEAA